LSMPPPSRSPPSAHATLEVSRPLTSVMVLPA
jgi:hypothetical protein